MNHNGLIQRGTSLQVEFEITNTNEYNRKVFDSPKFVISGNAIFQVRVIVSRIVNYFNNLIFVRFYKRRPDENLNYSINFTCEEFAVVDKYVTSDENSWHLVHENNESSYTFNVKVLMDVVPPANSFAPLLEDEESTDFELRGDDGAVRVHKAVFAASSPVLMRMVCGTWRESKEGHVEIPGTSKETLQHLKDYIYLYKLPEVGLEQLLLIASCYMLTHLEQKCVDKLVQGLTAQNVCDLLEFALKNKMTRLMLTIFESVRNDEVEVTDIRNIVGSAGTGKESRKESTDGGE